MERSRHGCFVPDTQREKWMHVRSDVCFEHDDPAEMKIHPLFWLADSGMVDMLKTRSVYNEQCVFTSLGGQRGAPGLPGWKCVEAGRGRQLGDRMCWAQPSGSLHQSGGILGMDLQHDWGKMHTKYKTNHKIWCILKFHKAMSATYNYFCYRYIFIDYSFVLTYSLNTKVMSRNY